MPFLTEQIYLFAGMVFLYGLLFGSFFNVLICRLPAEESIIFPASHCPNCKHKLSWNENIPILSFLLLCGKCKECKTKISIQYPAVELITGIYSVLLFVLFLPQIQSAQNWWTCIEIFFKFFTFLLFVPLTIIDLKHYIIPDELTISGLVVSFLISFLPAGITPLESTVGALSGGGFLFFAGLIGKIIMKKEAMGGGDVKFMLWIGALFGFKTAFASIFIGSIIGTIIGVFLILFGKTKNDGHLPFCPYLCAGTLISVIFNDKIFSILSLN
ncbi:MAG: prepilin peptidase [Chitinispirillales bacterium]|jgi:leader peptidase (prepilin peptidase)/N-methyltransferase|nr:prepilin peptidase [Chitinispirillales bacterium]